MVCQSVAAPSTAEYWHIGETTMRLASVSLRSENGVKSGGVEGGGTESEWLMPYCRRFGSNVSPVNLSSCATTGKHAINHDAGLPEVVRGVAELRQCRAIEMTRDF